MKSFAQYLKAISETNMPEEAQVKEWLFHPGMLFLSRDKWWGDFKCRATAHEGIDICFFRTAESKVRYFNPKIRVPAMEDGRIINICNDFLGQSLVVERQSVKLPYTRILIVYAHISPDENLKIKDSIKENQIIAEVCDTVKNPLLRPHLHISCFETAKRIKPEELNWTFFSSSIHACPINPVFLP